MSEIVILLNFSCFDFSSQRKLIVTEVFGNQPHKVGVRETVTTMPQLCEVLGTLKSELVYHKQYETREEAIRNVTEYIEIFSNRQRRQKRLGYLSPAAFERKYYEKLLAA